MNRLTTLLIFITFLTSCSSKSDEDRAKELIKDYLKENMHDPSSYEPVEFEALDSMKTYYFDDENHKALQEEMMAKPFLIDSILPLMDSIESNFKPELRGYAMRHRYRAKNAVGAKVLSKKVFRFDIDITKVLSSDDTSD